MFGVTWELDDQVVQTRESRDLDVFAYVETPDWGESLGVAQDLNLRIMDIVAEGRRS